jgi:uncharacterized protein
VAARRDDEWPATLDIATARADGWRPVPFRQFVVKVHSRCNLACDYCYVFEGADHTWRDRPTHMATEVVDTTCERIVEHAARHRLARVAVVLHGGEPTLAPLPTLERFATNLREGLPAGVGLDLRIQTNAVTLTEATIDRLLGHGFRFGVSLDGGAEANDRHRRYANGAGSHARVDAALRRLGDRPGALTGLLCTVDLRNDPAEVFDSLAAYRPPVIDFLLPHGNWDAPPPGRPPDATTPYGDWLVAAFEHWSTRRSDAPRVRFFEEILFLLLGQASQTELVGLSPSGVLVIETDGAIEQVDALKSAYHRAADTGLDVRHHDLDACFEHPGVVARQLGAGALSDTCRACPVHRICGGGYFPHRYRSGSGFRNPSVYCEDLQRVITHIAARVDSLR